jgi:capsule polysaccharide export protein KpsE/RkpR
MANQYVLELQTLVNKLAITEAQQRRAFFEVQLQLTRDRLTKAQTELQGSGFNPGTLRLEPRISTEGYVKLKAEIAAAEVKLQALRGRLTDESPEIQAHAAALRAMQAQLVRYEQSPSNAGGPDYVGKYREFKYQEALFEVYARQFEVARVDESREGALIQVVDSAQPPELKSYPKRALSAVAATMLAFGLQLLVTLWRKFSRVESGAAVTPRPLSSVAD